MSIIEVRNLTKRFGDFTALEDINLTIYPKDVVAIIGSSGSGKSTLLRCMNRLIEPTTGQVFFEGREITVGGGVTSADWPAWLNAYKDY